MNSECFPHMRIKSEEQCFMLDEDFHFILHPFVHICLHCFNGILIAKILLCCIYLSSHYLLHLVLASECFTLGVSLIVLVVLFDDKIVLA